MSAAEKLEALDAVPSAQAIVVLRAVLPQIVAVVEAAEEGMLTTRNAQGVQIASSWARARRPVLAALAALDEALT